MPTDEEATVRDRLAKLAAEGRHAECEGVAWQLADHIMRGPVGLIHIGDSLSSARRGCAIQSSRRRKTRRGTASNECRRLGAARLMATTLHQGRSRTAIRLGSQRNGSHRHKGQPRSRPNCPCHSTGPAANSRGFGGTHAGCRPALYGAPSALPRSLRGDSVEQRLGQRPLSQLLSIETLLFQTW